MQKLFLMAVLGTGIGTASFFESPVAAQAKKPADDKKMDDKKMADSKPGKIEIKEGKDSKFRFIVHDSDGDFLCTSAAFKSEKECLEGIDDLKKVLANTKPTMVKGVHDQDEKMEKTDKKGKGK